MSNYYNLKISTDKTKILTFKGKQFVRSNIEIDGSMLEKLLQFNYLGFELSLEGEPEFDKSKRIPSNMRHCQESLKENRTETQMEFYKAVARPSLLYGSETWVTTERDMTGLEAAEMRIVRMVKGYTRLDKIRSGVTRMKLVICRIQDVRLKYKQNWINHLERMDNTRLPKQALKYKPRGGRREGGRPRKQWECVDIFHGGT